MFWETTLRLGRLPAPEEFARDGELRQALGSPNRALRLFVKRGGGELLKQSTEARRNDLLVYMAQLNLRKRLPAKHLSRSLRLDIRTFFSSHKGALAEGLELLYAAGDPGEIEGACEGLAAGRQDEQALYVHRTLVDHLPPVLRAYVGCASTLFGDLRQADVIKLHKSSGRVTFLAYDDFDGKPLPELRARIKVNLRARSVQVFDHSAENQILFFKELLLPPTYPGLLEMRAFSEKVRELGISEELQPQPSGREWARLLEMNNLKPDLTKRHESSDAYCNANTV
jgi:DNA phosphorothioation-associated putative methyltransferase